MVDYVKPFTPLIEMFPYLETRKKGTILKSEDPHPPDYGWSMCPCAPLPPEECTSLKWPVDILKAWKREIIKLEVDDVYHVLYYFHQIPIVDTMYQFNEDTSAYTGTVFDSAGRLTKSTIREWNISLDNKLYSEEKKESTWKIIREKAYKSKAKYNIFLFNTKTKEKHKYADGIMIEPVDIFMDWLNL